MNQFEPSPYQSEITVDDLNNAERFLLLLLGADNGSQVPGNLWLQKEMFLISREFEPLSEYLSYKPHLQGPYSDTLSDILDNLQYMGLARKDRRDIRLTGDGAQLAAELKRQADEDLVSLVESIKKKNNDLSKDELLAFIYYSYPEMTNGSLEMDDIEKQRDELAVSLYNKDRIGVNRAADIAGMPVDEFEKSL
ncbi:hypothetical protein [Natrarchaeobaculum sulfurireducens]|uniref:Uncharacterized protein n=1 Tax=Natrarchaeobaculum sulfurireducens TaxID=2044521 RepID=A0A346PDV7_9EURY|nr:hypothetical protein [Natrarchaeobaculum sulfurireducens]AXR77702.1 hypothetical protein AArc1_1367 [Natrarchaeobaculum sulfurireducens]